MTSGVGAVLSRPSLWLLGALGFMVRGGIVLLALPVLILPSPVALRVLLGDNLTSTGFTAGFYVMLAVAAALLVALALAVLVVIARVELAAFERLRGRRVVERRGLLGSLFTVQLIGLCALVAAAIPLVVGAVSVTYAELIRPTLGAPLYDRVLGQLGGPLFLLLAVLVLVEIASAVASRRLMLAADRAGSAVGSPLTAVLIGLGRPVIRPLPTLATALIGWLVTLGLLAPAVWALDLAWGTARGALLSTQSLPGGEQVGSLIAVMALCAAWLLTLAAAGLASALRAGLWSSEEQR